MKKKLFGLISLIFSLVSINAQTSIIKLPLTIKKGFGNFEHFFFGFRWDDTSKLKRNVISKITGAPETLKNIKYAVIFLEPYQFFYQSYIAKVITLDEFKRLQKDLNWTPNLKRLVKQNIDCYVTVLSSINSTDEQIYMVDKNHNYSFKDEEILIPVDSKASENELLNNLVTFKYQRNLNNNIVTDSATISIVKTGDGLNYGMAEYATTKISVAGKKYNLQICPLLFLSRSFIKSEISVTESGKTDFKVDPSNTIKDGDYLHLGNQIYKHLGVDLFSNTLKLKKVNATEYYSPQVGSYAPLFKEYSIDKKSLISTGQYKGKYLFINFWGTWCKPCGVTSQRVSNDEGY